MKKFILLLLICGSASASDWKLLQKNDEQVIFLDKDSIVGTPTMRKAWFLINFLTPQSLASQNSGYQSARFLYYFNCKDRAFATVQGAFFSDVHSEGKLVHRFTLPKEKIEFADLMPDSVGEANWKIVCNWPLQKPSDFRY